MDKGLLKRATEDSKEPTPGYMYKEIVKMTFLDLKTQDKVLEFLLDKLQDASNKSTYVLSKTLRVLKHICMEGHADCQKTIQKNAETIRTCANYRGKTDPTFGDMLNQQVRDAAREAMEAAFSTRRDNRNALVIGEGHGANKQQENSLSNSTFSTGYTVGATAHEASTHAVNVITTHVKAAVKNGFGLWKEPPKTAKQKIIEEVQRQSTAQTHGQYQKLSVPVTEDTYNVHVPVPRSVMNDIAKDRGHNQHIEADWKNLGSETATLPSAKQQQQEEKSEHQKLVGKITSMKETPQRFELSNFFQSVSASVQRELCSWDEIVGELDAALAPTQGWQTRLNAVCCIETIIKQNVDVVVEHYTQAPEDLQRCVNVVQRTLKDRAEKVLTLLGVPHKLSRTSETGKRADVVASVFSGGADGKRDITWSSSLSASALANINENPLGELEGALKVKDRSGRSRGQNNKLRKRNANNNSTTAGVEHSDDHDSAMVQVNKVNHDCSSSSNGKAQQPASGSKKLDFMDELFSSDVTSSCQESHPSTLTQIPSAGAFLDPSLFQQGVVSTSMNAVEQPAPPAPMSAAEAADTWISNIANGMKTRTTMSQSNEGSSFTSVGTQPHANPKPVSNFGFMT